MRLSQNAWQEADEFGMKASIDNAEVLYSGWFIKLLKSQIYKDNFLQDV